MSKEVIIIGAGIGGLSAASLLAHKGFKVTVLEKNAIPGGKILQIKKNGFTFDGGASFITLTKIYEDHFKLCGAKRSDYITWKKMGKTTTFNFWNGKQFTISTDVNAVRNEIATKFPGNETGFDRFNTFGAELYKILYSGPNYGRRNYHKLGGLHFLFDRDILSHLPKLHLFKSWKTIVDECFDSDELRAVFSYQATFMGMQPSEALGTYAFIPWAEIHDGMYNVKGGVYGIVEGFVKLCKDKGVKFHYNSEVTKLNYMGNKLESVEAGGKLYKADLFVNNSDGAYFYTKLMPPEKNIFFKESKLRKMKHTNAYFTINLGLKKPIPGVYHHTFSVGEEWKDYFRYMFTPDSVNKLNEKNLCYYMLQPSDIEPTMAPKGKAVLFILVPVCGYDPDFDWNTHENTFKNKIYDLIEKRDNIPLRDLIEEEIVYSPARWGKEFNLWENVLLSFSLNFMQTNNLRMPNKSREFTNLYFVGSSTIPGPALPPCIASGALVTERILEDL